MHFPLVQRRRHTSESGRRPDRVALPIFGAHLIRLVLLPYDAHGGSVDPEDDAIIQTVYGHAADRNLAEAVTVIALFGGQGLRVFIK